MNPARACSTAVLVCGLIISAAAPCSSQTWNGRCRLSTALEHDSNIFETSDHPLGSAAWQSALYIAGTGRLFSRLTLSGDYQGGVKLYPGHTGENRMSHNAAFIANAAVTSRLALFLDSRLFFRKFFGDSPGLNRIILSPGLRWGPAPRIRVRLYVSGISVNYSEGNYYDYREFQARSEIRFLPPAGGSWFLHATAGQRRYQRDAFLYDTVQFWRRLDESQTDEYLEVGAGAELYGFAYIRLSAGMRWQGSNSFGYRYRQPLLSLTAARHLIRGTILTVHASLRLRRYGDNLDPALQTRPGSEAEENSYLLIDLAHNLTARSTLHMRAGRYLDESPIASIYYTKNIISIGFTQRL